MRFGCHFGRFWRPKWSQKNVGSRFFEVFFGVQKCSSFLSCFGSPPRRLKRVQEAPKRPQEASRSAPRAPRGLQERSRRLQEGVKRPQEPVKRAQNSPKSSQDPPKTPTRLFRSTWPDSRFRKILKNQIVAPKSIEDA